MKTLNRIARAGAAMLLLALQLPAAIQYAGGTNVNTTFTQGGTGTRREIVDGMVAALTTAGWSTVSGAATGDVVMQTATTPQGLAARVRIQDPGAGNCAQVTMRNANGTVTATNPMWLLPAAGEVWRVIANKYQFFIFTTSSVSASRKFASGGTLYVPSFAGITESIWGLGAATSDTDTVNRSTFRTSFNSEQNTAGNQNAGSVFALVNGSAINQAGNGGGAGNGWPQLVEPTYTAWSYIQPIRWFEDSSLISEPLMAWGIGSIASNSKITGQLWDAVLVTDTFVSDQTFAIDTHNFWSITHNNAGTASKHPAGTLLVVVP